MNIQVFVIGRLGELVKKVAELELLLEEDANNSVAILELASYNQVLAAWPVQDPDNIAVVIHDFKIAVRKYVAADKDFTASIGSKNHHRLELDSTAYLVRRDMLKAKLKQLNALGRYVGNDPMMSLTLTQGESNATS